MASITPVTQACTRRWLGRVAVRVGAATGVLGAACSGASSGASEAGKTKPPITLTWWAGNGQDAGFIAIKDAYMQRYPSVTVQYEKEASHLKPENLVAGVLSGTAPDATRFADAGLGDWAAKDALLPLDDRLKKAPLYKKADFVPRLLDSGKWAGKQYAIPFLTDTRPMYWNKEAFKTEGLDPDKGPADWEALKEVALRLTRRRDPGYDRVGFLPLFGNSWLYLFGWLAGGEPVRFSPDGTKVRCILNEAPWIQALEYLTTFYKELGGADRLDAWLKEANGTGAQQAMLTGKLAMIINTDNWGGTNLGRYAPDLDFAVSLPPPPKGKAPLTWSGIWNMVVMKSSKLPDDAAEFITFVTAVDGLRAWAQGSLTDLRTATSAAGGYWYPAVATNRAGGDAIYDVAKGQMPERGQTLRRFSQEALQSSKTRPVMPAGLEVWDAQGNAAADALAGKGTPKALLDNYSQIANVRLQELGVYF